MGTNNLTNLPIRRECEITCSLYLRLWTYFGPCRKIVVERGNCALYSRDVPPDIWFLICRWCHLLVQDASRPWQHSLQTACYVHSVDPTVYARDECHCVLLFHNVLHQLILCTYFRFKSKFLVYFCEPCIYFSIGSNGRSSIWFFLAWEIFILVAKMRFYWIFHLRETSSLLNSIIYFSAFVKLPWIWPV